MIAEVRLEGRRVRLHPARSIGKGGEADVYDLGDGRALKVFKTPAHPDYAASPDEQRAAARRVAEHQEKLRAFPMGLPPEVIAPQALATDRAGKTIVGYAMPLVARAEPLLRFAEPTYRRAFAPASSVVALFRELWGVLSALHARGVLVGDFNDLNVLVTEDRHVRLIDADSFQFGPFACAVFTERFVDPRLCDRTARAPRPAAPYDADADWYAFTALLMQSLLFVGPFGGTHRPKDPARRVPPSRRPLERLTVFHSEVIYPKPATSWGVLPDALLARLRAVFERDERGVFPPELLEGLAFVTCAACGIEHARPRCPACSTTPARAGSAVHPATGRADSERVFATSGVIVSAYVEGGALRLVHYEAGVYKDESGDVLPDPSPRRGTVWIEGAELRRASAGPFGAGASERVGEVLENQTRVWSGPAFGLGFYRAQGLARAFVFEVARGGINDELRLPPLRGELVQSACAIDDRRAWLFLALKHAGRVEHLCFVHSRRGQLEASAKATQGDGSWLGVLGGAAAAGGVLLVPTDGGVVRVVVTDGGALEVDRCFSDTEGLVDERSTLLAGARGLYVVGIREARLVRRTKLP